MIRVFFILFLFFNSFTFACDTSSHSSAYESYIDAKQNYIKAILDGDQKKEIKSLQEIVKCGKFLGVDVSRYQKELNKYKPHHSSKKTSKQKINKTTTQQKKQKKTKIQKNSAQREKSKKQENKLKTTLKQKHNTKKVTKKTTSPVSLKPSYIRVVGLYPLKIKLNSKMKLLFSTSKNKYRVYKIFEISNAKISKKINTRISKNVYVSVAQNDKNMVRVVLYSRKEFKIAYAIKDGYLIARILDKPIPKRQQKQTITLPLFRKKIIVIDPGHGGKDTGGIGVFKIREKDIVLKIGRYLRDILRKRGYKVYMTRDRNIFIPLPDRTKFANRHHADLFISIHCNIIRGDPKVHGPTTYYLSPARTERASRVAKYENRAIGNLKSIDQQIVLNFLNKERIIQSDKFGMDVQRNIVYNLRKHYDDIHDRGVRPAPFWVLVGTQMPAILIETGFLTNKKEALRLNSTRYQKILAKGIADGIDSYFLKNR